MTKFQNGSDVGIGVGGVRRRSLLLGGVALAVLTAGLPLSASAQGTPKAGGIIRVAVTADIQPRYILAGRGGNNVFRHNVFDTLTVLDSESGRPRAILATDWESSEDGLTFKVRIRDDVKFHTGRPMTAADVVFTLQQVGVPENASQMRPLVEAYTSIEATGDYEVTITSDTPVAPRVFDVFQLATIVDQETYAGLMDGSQVIGTGPFKFVDWVTGASVRMERNEDYWGETAHLDAIEILVISDPTAMANSLRGRVDLVVGITPRDAIIFRNDPNIDIFQSPGGGMTILGIDVTAPPFDNKVLRQAIGFAIDRQRIIDQIFDGSGETYPLWWRETEPGITQEMTGYYSYDPEKARAMIAEAGAEGIDVPMQVLGYGTVPAVYEIVQNNLRAVGLNPTGGVVETAVFDDGQAKGELGPVFMQAHGLQGFSAATLVDALPALRPSNPSKMDDPRYVELKSKLQSAQTDEDYAAAMSELALFMLDEAFSHVLVRTPPLTAKNAKLDGIVFDNVGYVHLGKAWINS